MTIRRIARDVTLYFQLPPTGAPDEYLCSNQPLGRYVLEVGNPAGSAVFDVRAELAPLQPTPTNVYIAGLDVPDDTHVSMICCFQNDVTPERAKYRLIIFYDT